VAGGADDILRRAALGERANLAMSRLSGGEAARLFIATANVHRPELLFLDEPTAPLDPRSKREVGAMLREMAADRTLVLTTHDLREADELCDWLVFLVAGRVRAAGAKEELVASVPPDSRRGLGVEDAFFHFCAVHMRGGEVLDE
jgi:ABC-2 type transport system ATP-binding protein